MAVSKKKVAETVATKSLTVTLVDRNRPNYVFEGEWVGRDIKVVLATVVRAYRLNVLAQRRSAAVVSDLNEIPQLQEAAK